MPLLAGELAFVPHEVQAAAVAPLATAMYLPAAQAVHESLPATADCPAEQAEQSVAAAAPEVARYLPATQSWQGFAHRCAAEGTADCQQSAKQHVRGQARA